MVLPAETTQNQPGSLGLPSKRTPESSESFYNKYTKPHESESLEVWPGIHIFFFPRWF